MEKANGRKIGDIWYQLSEKERMKVVVQVARVESVLFSIYLSVYGSIYFKGDLESGTETVGIRAGDATGNDASQTSGQM